MKHLTDQEVIEQHERFYVFLNRTDLAKIGKRLSYFIRNDAKNGRYTPYMYLLRVLSLCANVEGSCEHSSHRSYRDVLEFEAMDEYIKSIHAH